MTDLAVIMSTYRNDKIAYLKQSVESILTQTYSNFHFLIVFDGPVSTEIETYITNIKDERIKLYRIEDNGGLARALNLLLEIVLKNPEYKYIARMDADDISMINRFEKQRNSLEESHAISIVGCWYQEIDEHGTFLAERKLPINHEKLRYRFYFRIPFAHPSVMYRTSMIKKAGLYPVDTYLMEDIVLWGRVLNENLHFANIPEFLLKYRKDGGFYRRRSGIRYGWQFIITKFKINKLIKSPFYSYIVTFFIGIIKMMPTFILRYFYVAARKF